MKYEKTSFLKKNERKDKRVVAKVFKIFIEKIGSKQHNLRYLSSIYQTEACHSHESRE